MRLWRRAAGAFKDRNSLWVASLLKRTSARHPEIETAIVKATSHGESSLNRPYIDRAFDFVRRSPVNLKPFLRSLAGRMEKTRSWAVALKGLYLMHLVVNSKLPGVNRIGRIPFDLSNFSDAHSSSPKGWSFNVFIRTYYIFLDHKSSLFYNYTEGIEESGNERRRRPGSITLELVFLQKLLPLIDFLIQIKPQARAASSSLVLDVMEEIIIEILQVYSKICGAIAAAVENISSADRVEAMAALDAAQKASIQGEQLASYFEYCNNIGIVNSADMSFIDRFPDEGIKNLEQIVYAKISEEEEEVEDEKAIVVITQSDRTGKDSFLKTIITHKWENFEEDSTPTHQRPFLTMVTHSKNQELPDLIIL